MGYTGIIKSRTDAVQPYRVWHNGKIVYFAKTQQEANRKLWDEQRRPK